MGHGPPSEPVSTTGWGAIMSVNSDQDIIKSLLFYEHQKVAAKLSFINSDPVGIDKHLLKRAIGVIDRFSRMDDDRSKNTVITFCGKVSRLTTTCKTRDSHSGIFLK